MSNSDTTTPDQAEGDGDGGVERTRVRRRSVRGKARDPFAVTPAADDEQADSADTPGGGDADRGGDDGGGDTAAAAAEGSDSAGEEGDDGPRRRRRRRGGRGRGGRGRSGRDAGPSGDDSDADSDDASDDASDEGAGEDVAADDSGSDETTATDETSTERTPARSSKSKGSKSKDSKAKSSKSMGTEAQDSASDDASADAEGSDAGDDSDSDDASEDGGSGGSSRSGRRRRRGRRGRGRRGKKSSDGGSSGGDSSSGGSTRLAARGKGSGGRRRVPTVSPETRRVMAESPPKRMLVTVGGERTQIAVLEERTLVEHYVTQASEQSYVGNIYKGRVQNVLPGMEAAFVDIGKGRNGVLYAGEVNYDEADREGGLPRIEQALKPGQSVLVQVTKDPMGTKGARLTQHLSLAGRYCVLAPGDDMLGISRKLPDEQRDRLRKTLKAIKPEGYGLIVRTAAESASAEQLEADVERLVERWKAVEEKAEKAKPLESIYAEPQLVLRVIRDVFGPEHTQLIIDDETLADEVRDYLREVSPEHVDKVVTYRGDDRLFDAYEVTTQVRRALEKKVWLKSGGYLIIEKTEAMWVIDVNTGKFVGKDNLEETVLRNNLEAAEEIAKQLRLRDMGGIIVIDFVDMIVPANRDEVLKRFKRELARDKTKSRVMEISKLGLVQMTRKNVSKGLMESFTEETDDAIPGRRIVEDLLA